MFPEKPMSVSEQVEMINDTATKNVVDVIVQLEPATRPDSRFRKRASDVLEKRRSSLSPREMLPAKPAKTKSAKKSALKRPSISKAKKQATKSLDSLLKNDNVQKSMVRMESSQTKKRGGSKRSAAAASPSKTPVQFWTSQSMRLTMTKDELAEFSKEVPNIRSINLNRKLHVPIIKKSKPLALESDDRLSISWGLHKSNALAAWGVYGAEGQGVTVAVLDTGVDAEHPDLEGKIKHWAEIDASGNIINTDNPRDSDQHGTHVCGTVAGGNASGRWIGMAPQVDLAVALVLDGEIGGTDAQVLKGMDWAIENGFDVINMSLGGLVFGSETPPTYAEAIVTALDEGIPVVAAIGNEGEQTTGSPGNDLFAISVGATDAGDRVAGFSGGRTQILFESEFLNPDILPLPYIKPDVSAPGVSIFSSVPNGKWDTFSGTSMATPHVCGAIALLLSATNIRQLVSGADLTFLIQELITGSVDDIGESGQDSRYGFGRIDILRAIDFAIQQGFGE